MPAAKKSPTTKKSATKTAPSKKPATKKPVPAKRPAKKAAKVKAGPRPASKPARRASPPGWAQVLGCRGVDLAVVAAAFHNDRLYVAVDAVDNDDKTAQAGALFAVDITGPVKAELVYEASGSLKDYVCHDGAHLLLFRDALVTLRAGAASRVAIALEKKVTPAGPWGEASVEFEELRRVAPCGAGVLVTSETHDDGVVRFIHVRGAAPLELPCAGPQRDRFIDGDRVEVVLRCSSQYEPSGLGALWCDGGHAVVVGAYGAYFAGAPQTLTTSLPEAAFAAPPDSPGRHSLLAVHRKPDGTVLVGGRDMAAVVAGGTVQRITNDLDGMYVHGVVEHDGVEVWAMRNFARIVLSRRNGLKLAPSHEMKCRPVLWRAIDAPPLRLTSSGDRLLVTEADRVHVGDGKTFTQLKLSTDPVAPFRRIGVGLKPV